MSGALQSLYTWKNCLIFHNSNVTLISPTSPAPSAINIANLVFFHFQFQMQEHEGFHSWLIDMPTLENAIKSVHETSNSLVRWLALIIICYCVQADKFGENAFWSFDVVVQQGLICVWLLWEPVLTTRGSRSCVNASILHITCSGAERSSYSLISCLAT